MEKRLTWQVPKVRLLKLEGWKIRGQEASGDECINGGEHHYLMGCYDGSLPYVCHTTGQGAPVCLTGE